MRGHAFAKDCFEQFLQLVCSCYGIEVHGVVTIDVDRSEADINIICSVQNNKRLSVKGEKNIADTIFSQRV